MSTLSIANIIQFQDALMIESKLADSMYHYNRILYCITNVSQSSERLSTMHILVVTSIE